MKECEVITCSTCNRIEFRESINRYEGNYYWCPVRHIKIKLDSPVCDKYDLR